MAVFLPPRAVGPESQKRQRHVGPVPAFLGRPTLTRAWRRVGRPRTEGAVLANAHHH